MTDAENASSPIRLANLPVVREEGICVCGAGTMGKAIAELTARHGYRTILFDIDLPHSDNPDITTTKNINDCIADIIIEAIIENEESKTALFHELAKLNSRSTIFATNTSSISITSIAEKMPKPESFAGLHFFNPVKAMKLVEIIKTSHTSETTVNRLEQFAASLNKTSVTCADSPGFIVNRVARPFYLEALRLAENHDIPIPQIDELMKATGFKMGPFELMDLIGNDVNFKVSQTIHHALGEPERLKPSNLQQQKVENNQLGRKTGIGFYDYATKQKADN
ncbi:MAG: 3-hydroxyacyl-CoA dehydrogenase NAD-binding domain-containing protein [Flavitalea sp.]